MIVTLLLIGLPLGFIVGMSRRYELLAVGAAVTIVGWWILMFTVGDVTFALATLVLTTFAALGNLLVGTFIGWGIGAGLRVLFGMTAER